MNFNEVGGLFIYLFIFKFQSKTSSTHAHPFINVRDNIASPHDHFRACHQETQFVRKY